MYIKVKGVDNDIDVVHRHRLLLFAIKYIMEFVFNIDKFIYSKMILLINTN